VAELNAQGFAGFEDWRIPNVRELQSIADYGRFAPAVDPSFHGPVCGTFCPLVMDPACGCTASGAYWSSTTVEASARRAWNVRFRHGTQGTTAKTYNRAVRAVRGGS
jgi:hypothetical protein